MSRKQIIASILTVAILAGIAIYHYYNIDQNMKQNEVEQCISDIKNSNLYDSLDDSGNLRQSIDDILANTGNPEDITELAEFCMVLESDLAGLNSPAAIRNYIENGGTLGILNDFDADYRSELAKTLPSSQVNVATYSSHDAIIDALAHISSIIRLYDEKEYANDGYIDENTKVGKELSSQIDTLTTGLHNLANVIYDPSLRPSASSYANSPSVSEGGNTSKPDIMSGDTDYEVPEQSEPTVSSGDTPSEVIDTAPSPATQLDENLLENANLLTRILKNGSAGIDAQAMKDLESKLEQYFANGGTVTGIIASDEYELCQFLNQDNPLDISKVRDVLSRSSEKDNALLQRARSLCSQMSGNWTKDADACILAMMNSNVPETDKQAYAIYLGALTAAAACNAVSQPTATILLSTLLRANYDQGVRIHPLVGFETTSMFYVDENGNGMCMDAIADGLCDPEKSSLIFYTKDCGKLMRHYQQALSELNLRYLNGTLFIPTASDDTKLTAITASVKNNLRLVMAVRNNNVVSFAFQDMGGTIHYYNFELREGLTNNDIDNLDHALSKNPMVLLGDYTNIYTPNTLLTTSANTDGVQKSSEGYAYSRRL